MNYSVSIASAIREVRILVAVVVFQCCCLPVSSQTKSVENIKLKFPVLGIEVADSFDVNRAAFLRLDTLNYKVNDGSLTVDSIVIEGWASPEGRVAQNKMLALQRREALRQLLLDRKIGYDSIIFDGPAVDGRAGIPWEKLARQLRKDQPSYAADVLAIIADKPAPGKYDTRKKRLMDHNYGRTWHKMLEKYFPDMRIATAVVYLTENIQPEQPELPEAVKVETVDSIEAVDEIATVVDTVAEADTIVGLPAEKNFYMSVSTNMLLDVAALPNIAAEFYVGKQFSVTGGWMYGWWDSKSKNRFWRAYGGQIGGRYWFGKLAETKPLTGHHIGLYAQAFIYDFEWGGKGYLAGTPNHNIFNHPTIAAGVEYGFALPIARRLNLEFNIGIGYQTGRYYEYEPMDGHYVMLRAKQQRWFGPTKAEVGLVWLLGHGNFNGKDVKK